MEPIPVAELMSQLGPETPGIVELTEVEPRIWTISWQDGATITAELDDDEGVLTLSTVLGTPADRLDVYDSLLLYNTLWRDTGGIRMGVAGQAGDVVMAIDLSAARLDVEALSGAMRGFAAMAGHWRPVVARDDAPPEPAPPPFTILA